MIASMRTPAGRETGPSFGGPDRGSPTAPDGVLAVSRPDPDLDGCSSPLEVGGSVPRSPQVEAWRPWVAVHHRSADWEAVLDGIEQHLGDQ